MKGTRAAWLELAGWNKQSNPDRRSEVGWPHPETLKLLAVAVGVTLPPMPEWTPPTATAEPVPNETVAA